MRLIPINLAEAIFEPFWDPALSQLEQWTVHTAGEEGRRVEQNWCNVQFFWEKPSPSHQVLHMERSCQLDAAGYDTLVVSAVLPEDGWLVITAVTSKGTVSRTTEQGGKVEEGLTLPHACCLLQLRLEAYAKADRAASGWLNWMGLHNSGLLKRYAEQWNCFDGKWEGYLTEEGFEPSYKPCYGIAVTEEELASGRKEYQEELACTGTSVYIELVRPFLEEAPAPERQIREYARFWQDSRFARVRENDQYIVSPGSRLLMHGLLARDKGSLRLAARYALSLCMIPNWCDGFIARYPGGVFEHRAFVQSLIVTDLAYILDGAGELFTPLGRELIQRRMMEEGLAGINFITWKHSYIFDCNQLAWFTAGRLLGYAVLSREYPRIRPYMEQAYREICESMDRVVEQDGSTLEGPTYFMCQPDKGGSGIYYYARALARPFELLLPERLRLTGDYIDAVFSTDKERDFITICDCGPRASLRGAAVMARLLPDSLWVNLFHKIRSRNPGMCGDLMTEELARSIPSRNNPPKPFVRLPEAGYISSVRSLNGGWLKLFIMGHKAGAGHTHEDKGSFVIEYAGETFAMDPGTCSYSSPLSVELQHCQWHNMLIPGGMPERPHPHRPLVADVKPEGWGDGQQVEVLADLGVSFSCYYKRWTRRFYSSSPALLTVTDDYELVRGNRVDFLLHTLLPCQIKGRGVEIRGKNGRCTINVPEGCRIAIQELPYTDGQIMHRLRIGQTGVSGRLEVEFIFS
ncbi:heparinase II/III family protein [Paenibacillus sp. YN15]|uniref:heparinase II/III family protein n=1 Tax=Paenibacillus sp. YN15 TaxID=1742774 RepID=UPI0015EC20C6|nr:heparinase II/III family protein [Paenibacillus sp. YN15]